MSFRCQIDITALLTVSFLSISNFSALETYSKLIWHSAESMYFNDIDVIADIETISFGNFGTTQIIMNKEFLSSSK